MRIQPIAVRPRASIVASAFFVVLLLIQPGGAMARTFFEWAADQGYGLGDALPGGVDAPYEGIHSLAGMSSFDWTATPTTTLDLCGNQITIIRPDAFVGLDYLIHLNLAQNQIMDLQPGGFNGLDYLTTHVTLDCNQITSIHAGDFAGLDNLTHLSLYDNRISVLESGAFTGLGVLTDLNLDANQIGYLEPGCFSGLGNLRRLSLRDNHLSDIEIDPEVPSGLGLLKELYLDRNQIETLQWVRHSEMRSLETLSLVGNQIHETCGWFGELASLVTLDLGENQITSIGQGSFEGPANLTFLSLADNQITQIDSNVFAGLNRLEVLRLDGNMSLTDLNLEGATFEQLQYCDLSGTAITRVSLAHAQLSDTALWGLMDSLAALPGITELDLTGFDFAGIQAESLWGMDDVTDLWLAGARNLDPWVLDECLRNLDTMERWDVEGTIYMMEADYLAWNAVGEGMLAAWNGEQGHHVRLLDVKIPGDANGDALIDETDAAILAEHWGETGATRFDGDFDGDGYVGPADAAIMAANWGSGYSESDPAVPEPSTLVLLVISSICLVLFRRRA